MSNPKTVSESQTLYANDTHMGSSGEGFVNVNRTLNQESERTNSQLPSMSNALSRLDNLKNDEVKI